MAAESQPRVEVQLQAPKIHYLANDTRFDLVLLLTLRNSATPVTFLKSGFDGIEGLQAVNADTVVQCFDEHTGKQQQILRGDVQPSLLRLEPDRGGHITFTTSSAPKGYELTFDPSSLLSNRKYRLHFKPTSSITHWSSLSDAALSALSQDAYGPVNARDIPKPSTAEIAWDVPNGNDAISFETQSSPARAPKVSVSLSAPSTLSLSNHPPFTFTLTFSLDNEPPITALAERELARRTNSDIEILDAASRHRVGPELIDINVDGPWQREDFLCIGTTHQEHRTLDATCGYDGLGELQFGREYILRHLGGEWGWWTKESIDAVMTYAGERGGFGLGKTEAIQVGSAGEARFRVVE